MKNLKHIIVLCLFTIVVSSCDDVLEQAPQGVIAEGVSSAGTVDQLVVAAYAGLGAHFFGNDQSFAGPSTNWIMDVRSDDAYKGGGGITDRTDIHQFETATMDPTNFAVHQKWRNPMFAIARTNFAIREIQALDDLQYPKMIREGEMRFLRAFFHMDMLLNFNRIPFIDESTDPTAAGNQDLSVDEVWDRIEEDLDFAFVNLPISHDEIGRITKYAAAALQCKVFIYRQKWDLAIPKANFVISGPFALLTEFSDLASLEFENGTESIWTIQFSTANIFANHNWSNLLNVTLGPGIDNGAYANGDDFYLASQNLVNAYRTDASGLPLFDTFNDTDVIDVNYPGTLDPRVDHTIARLGVPWKGTAVYDNSWVRSPDYFPGFSGKKHVVAPDDPNVHDSFPWAASGLNFNMIRFAEVLLWKAEALIESGGDLDEARNLINQVRDRAANSTAVKTIDGSSDAANYNIGLYSAAGWDQTTARRALRFERRLELALEGHRMYDLNRWGVAAQTINTYFTEESDNVDYLTGISFESGKHEYLPIPQIEIDLAPTLYIQNPGY